MEGRKPQIVDLGKITIGINSYRFFLHEDDETLELKNCNGYCDHENHEVHVAAQFGTDTDGKIFAEDLEETKRIFMHEIGHAIHRENHAFRVLMNIDKSEGIAECSTLCMSFWDGYGPKIIKQISPHLKRGGEEAKENGEVAVDNV